MAAAWIRGKTASLDDAVAQAAGLLAASRLPVIAGLGTDVAGARAAVGLAQRLGGAIDHMHSAALLRNLDVMRGSGMMVTTPNEARLRGDLLLLVGPGLAEAWAEMPERLFSDGGRRRIAWLCPGDDAKTAGRYPDMRVLGEPDDLPIILAALRARCAGQPVGQTAVAADLLAALAADLTNARFGVALWSAAHLDTLTIDMLCGLVKDLNSTTRFSGLPLAPPDNAAAVQQVSGWMNGFPLPVCFARGFAEHDPWRFDATRLVESGEADCALWISCYGPHAPAWKRELPTIALAAAPSDLHADVVIAVGQPGIDHDAVGYLSATATIAALPARSPADALPAAEALAMIAAALPAARPC